MGAWGERRSVREIFPISCSLSPIPYLLFLGLFSFEL